MSNEKFKVMLELIIPQIVQLIMVDKKIYNTEAANLLYASELYEVLENEESKLWHLSAVTLYDLLNEELLTGKIRYPEEGV